MSATPSLGIYYLELLSKAGDSREALSLGQTPNWLQCQAWWHMQPLVITLRGDFGKGCVLLWGLKTENAAGPGSDPCRTAGWDEQPNSRLAQL